MKKCPYCAEEIQDEAILCRYCHSDLTAGPKVKEKKIPQKREISKLDSIGPRDSSAWKMGAIASAVITGLLAIFMFMQPIELTTAMIRLITSFFIWWLICAGFIWLWRKIGGGWTMFIVIVLIMLLVAAFWDTTVPKTGVFLQDPIPTLTSRLTQTPKPTPTMMNSQTRAAIEEFIAKNGDCLLLSEITEDMIGQDICVKGTVYEFDWNPKYANQGTRNALFINDITISTSTPSLQLSNAHKIYPDVNEGDCIAAYGRLEGRRGNMDPYAIFPYDRCGYPPIPTPTMITMTNSQTRAAIEEFIAKNGGCVYHSEVTEEMVGQEICAVGSVSGFLQAFHGGIVNSTGVLMNYADTGFIIIYSDDSYPDIKAGDCIRVYGKVQKALGSRGIGIETDYFYSFNGCE